MTLQECSIQAVCHPIKLLIGNVIPAKISNFQCPGLDERSLALGWVSVTCEPVAKAGAHLLFAHMHISTINFAAGGAGEGPCLLRKSAACSAF